MLYILKQTRYNRFKIGISRVPDKRIKKLEKTWGTFDDIKLFKTKNDRKKEQSLHNVFEGYQILNLEGDGHTEFFSTDCYDQVMGILNTTPKQYVQKYKIPFFTKLKGFIYKMVSLIIFLIILSLFI